MQVRRHVISFGVYVKFHGRYPQRPLARQKEKAWNEGWDANKESGFHTRGLP